MAHFDYLLDSRLPRKRVKNYYDESGNKIYEKELYKFNYLDIYETDEGETLVVSYENVQWDENDCIIGQPELIDFEEFDDFEELSYNFNIAEGKIYGGGQIYVDSEGKYLCGYGECLGVIRGTKKIISDTVPDYVFGVGYNDTEHNVVYSIWETRNNKTKKLNRTLKKLYLETITYYVDNNGNECHVVTDVGNVKSITRTMGKDKVVINYCDNEDNILNTEIFYFDENTIDTEKIEDKDPLYIGHDVNIITGMNENGEIREIWFEDEGIHQDTP